MDAHIHPSILSADFANFESEFATIRSADAIHIDVMDGHFVPNLTFGLPMVKRMRQLTAQPLDIHLMIENVDTLAVAYAEAGAESVTFHFEASSDPVQLARAIRKAGAKAAVAIKPGTPVSVLDEIAPEFDMILVMTVEPGFGGQGFMADMLPKVTHLHESLRGSPIRIQVDGGVDDATIIDAAKAGADTFVAGSCVFGSENRELKISDLRQTAQAHLRA